MREIKFRGKRVDNGEWVEGYYGKKGIEEYTHHYIMQSVLSNQPFTYFYFSDCEVIPETVGQYTGLPDKNGKEIYEGDIVKCVSELYSGFGKYPTGEFSTTYYEICSINENAYCFGERRIGEKYIFEGILRGCAKKYYEVIGNIFDNPELIESEE